MGGTLGVSSHYHGYDLNGRLLLPRALSGPSFPFVEGSLFSLQEIIDLPLVRGSRRAFFSSLLHAVVFPIYL